MKGVYGGTDPEKSIFGPLYVPPYCKLASRVSLLTSCGVDSQLLRVSLLTVSCFSPLASHVSRLAPLASSPIAHPPPLPASSSTSRVRQVRRGHSAPGFAAAGAHLLDVAERDGPTGRGGIQGRRGVVAADARGRGAVCTCRTPPVGGRPPPSRCSAERTRDRRSRCGRGAGSAPAGDVQSWRQPRTPKLSGPRWSRSLPRRR